MSWYSKSKTFLQEVRAEMAKVSFPSREEVIATTGVVVVTSFIFAIYLWGADQVIVALYQGVIGVFGV